MLRLYVFILFLSLASLTKLRNSYPWTVDVFSSSALVCANLYLKICPLLGQILITCLNCFSTSFLLSSYDKKIRWGRGWISAPTWNIDLTPFYLVPTTPSPPSCPPRKSSRSVRPLFTSNPPQNFENLTPPLKCNLIQKSNPHFLKKQKVLFLTLNGNTFECST